MRRYVLDDLFVTVAILILVGSREYVDTGDYQRKYAVVQLIIFGFRRIWFCFWILGVFGLI